MLLVTDRGLALGFMVIGIVLLGTWPAVWNYIERKVRCTTPNALSVCMVTAAQGDVRRLRLPYDLQDKQIRGCKIGAKHMPSSDFRQAEARLRVYVGGQSAK